MTIFNPRTLIYLFVIVLSSGNALGASRIDVADAIPAGAPWVLVADHIGGQAATVRVILDRFKDLVPELGSEKIASELKTNAGEDLASPEGMIAYGIDPEGSAALWADDFDHEPYIAIPLSDPDKFIERLSRQLKSEGSGISRPKVRAGVKIYSIEEESLGIKNGYMVMEPSGGGNNGIKAFFSPGKKLGRDKAFKSVLSACPKERDGLAYFSMASFRKIWTQHQKDFRKRTRALLKKSSAASKKMFLEELKGSPKTQKSFDKLLADFRGIGIWWQVGTDHIEGGALFATTPKGHKNMERIFPAPASLPGFHKRMIKASLMGGWSFVNATAFVNWIGDLPQAPWITMREELARSAEEFREEVKMDLFSDLIGNIKQPVSAYLLVPSMDGLDTKAPLESQFLSLVRVALVSEINDRKKAKTLLDHFDSMVDSNAGKLDHPKVQGVEISRLTNNNSKAQISWGQKDSHVILGVGKNPFDTLLNAISEQGSSTADMIAEYRMDFPAFSEVISSAVSKGIGGQGGMRFRMMWPIVKQVIGRFGALELKGFLRKGALEIDARMDMH